MDGLAQGRAGLLVPYAQAGGDVEEVNARGRQLLGEQGRLLDGDAGLAPVRGGDAEEDGLAVRVGCGWGLL
ncbi:hypothetical protein BSZ07_36695 [Streptomyces sp. M1013]|nr:hypothetical protein BSZ07_36695 [Streptomyces sp. M1013]